MRKWIMNSNRIVLITCVLQQGCAGAKGSGGDASGAAARAPAAATSSTARAPQSDRTFPVGEFVLQRGDFLFQDLDCGPMCDAIEAVTVGVAGAKLSHVAMVTEVRQGAAGGFDVTVIEAYADGVVEIPLEVLLRRSRDENGNPKVLVGRLINAYQQLIPGAIEYARKQLSKPYDEAFFIDNGAYYCSELLQEAFWVANGNEPLFELQPMTYRIPGQSVYAPVWEKHFADRGQAVPQGEPGSNPGAMSRSPALTIVHAYGRPEGWTGK